MLCAVYALIAIGALIATWSQNIAYSGRAAGLPLAFWDDTKVNPASRSITVDIVLFLLAAAILMVVEARKHGVKFVWAYILGRTRHRDQRDVPAVPDRPRAAHRPDQSDAARHG